MKAQPFIFVYQESGLSMGVQYIMVHKVHEESNEVYED